MALQGLYAAILGGSSPEATIAFASAEQAEPTPNGAGTYGLKLLSKTLERSAWAKDIITSKLEHWDFDRVTLVDRLILELALVEMVYFDDVPLKVSISEAIEIAKKFSTDESPGFVNGILDAVYHDILQGKLTAGTT